MNREPYKFYLDGISVLVSALCMIHCIALPVFFSTLPLWGIEILENGYIEFASILLTLAAGGGAIGNGYKRHHRSASVVFTFLTGVILLCLANNMEKEAMEMAAKGCGALLVIQAHYKNWKKCRKCMAA